MPSPVNQATEGVTMPAKERPGTGHYLAQLVSVVIAAGHDTARHGDLEDLRSCLQALASQKVDEPVEFLLVESDERVRTLPTDLITGLPG